MELSLVLTALRRKRWLIVLGALIGLVPGALLLATDLKGYQSTASVSISPPDSESSRWSNQPDRYVLGQIGVLRSSEVAESAAKRLGSGETADSVRNATQVGQRAQTDIVDVTATTGSAQRSQRIAQAVVDSYVAKVRGAAAQTRAPEIARLDEQLAALDTQITEANTSLNATMEPYVRAFTSGAANSVPEPSVIDPQTTDARDRAVAQRDQLLAIKTDLQFKSTEGSNTVVVSNASAGERASLVRDLLIVAGGAVVGGLLGVAAALLLAQLAGDTLDDATVSRVLGVAVAAHVAPDRALRPGPLASLETLPGDLATTIDKLCARADSMALSDEPLTVAVVGSQPRAGTTTLALAMARRFADFGFSVLVIDGDARRPYLTDLLAGPSDLGLNDLGSIDADTSAERLTATFDPRIRVLGQGAASDRPRLARQSVGPVLEFGRRNAQIVIVDAGAAMGSSFAIQACRAADAVVLAVPLDRQRTSALRETARQLESEAAKLIPVLTSPGRRGQGSGRGDTVVSTTGREVVAPVVISDAEPVADDHAASAEPDRAETKSAAGDDREETADDGAAEAAAVTTARSGTGPRADTRRADGPNKPPQAQRPPANRRNPRPAPKR